MSKLKATKSGKAGKHKADDTFSTAFMRGLRKGRVMTSTDQRLLSLIIMGSSEEQEGALAGKPKAKTKARYIRVVGKAKAKTARAPMMQAAG